MPHNLYLHSGLVLVGNLLPRNLCNLQPHSQTFISKFHSFYLIPRLYLHCRGKLLREKTFANFTVLWLFAKLFSVKHSNCKSEQSAKVSPRKLYFHQFANFSLLKVSCYTVPGLFSFSMLTLRLYLCFTQLFIDPFLSIWFSQQCIIRTLYNIAVSMGKPDSVEVQWARNVSVPYVAFRNVAICYVHVRVRRTVG